MLHKEHKKRVMQPAEELIRMNRHLKNEIEKRLQAEQALRESEERYVLYIENASDVICSIDLDLKFISMSPSIEHALGYTPDELIGKSILELNIFTDRSLEIILADAARIFSGEIIKSREHEFIAKDGTRKFGEISGAPLYRGNDIVAVVAFCKDITDRKDIENEIKTTKDFLENVFMTTGDGIIVTDPDGYIIKANRTYSEMTGYAEEELVRKHVMELGTADYTFKEMPGVIENFLVTGVVKNYETTIKQKDGSSVAVEVNLTALRSTEGLITGSVGAIRDITYRKKAEHALRESEQRFRSVVESANDAIITVDPTGTILYWNKGAEIIYGYSKNEVIGHSFLLTIPQRFHAAQQKFMNRFRSKRNSGLSIKTTEATGLRKDGAEFPSELTMAAWKLDNTVFITVILRDISKRKQADQALRESEQRYRTLVESASDPIITANNQGTIVYWNHGAQQVYGYTTAEIIGKSFLTIVPPRLHNVQDKLFQRALSGQPAQAPIKTAETIALRKGGTEFPIELTMTTWNAGDETFFTAITRDITERKLAEKALKEFSRKVLTIREEEKKQLSMNLHDELGSMAVAVSNALHIAKKEINNNNANHAIEALNRINTSFKTSVARMKKMAVELRPPELDILGLSVVLQEYCKNIATESEIVIDLEIELDDRQISSAAAIALYRVAQEGITNIIKHSQAKHALLRLFSQGDAITFIIEDNGMGFVLENSFKGTPSAHLGLLGMQERIESIGGTFGIASQPGNGTALRITVPNK